MALLHPNQFQVGEVWIAFKLNDAPICTEQDGEFNCICLMDAASCFILGTTLVSAHESELSELEVRRLFKAARAQKNKFPAKLLIPAGEPHTALLSEAQRHGISVARPRKGELRIFTSEARQGFRDYLQGGNEA